VRGRKAFLLNSAHYPLRKPGGNLLDEDAGQVLSHEKGEKRRDPFEEESEYAVEGD